VAAGLPSASLLENARFNALVIVPNAVQGLFRRRRAPVAAATRANVDGWAVGLLSGMRRGHGGGPVWVRVMTDRALLLLTPADVHRALQDSPDPFAADPETKRKGMCAFRPDALTISRGELWRNRRAFTEAVLDTGEPLHRFADRFATVAREETDELLIEADAAGGTLQWDSWQEAFRRLTRRVVLGDRARDDIELSDLLREMMSQGNGLPGKPSERYPAFIARISEYVDTGEPGSLVALFSEAPSDERTRPAGQAAHWLFATHDTLAINAFRCLALLATHPRQRGRVEAELEGFVPADAVGADVARLDYLEACLDEAMRLWPTTPMLSRETLTETDWGGVTVPAGTNVLIVNTFMHRDTERHPWADRFAPEQWLDGDASEDWCFNHFSRGPQGCPGAGLALFLGEAVLATLLRRREVTLASPTLDADRELPHMLDFFGLRFGLSPRPEEPKS
jgi:cytochrome P450